MLDIKTIILLIIILFIGYYFAIFLKYNIKKRKVLGKIYFYTLEVSIISENEEINEKVRKELKNLDGLVKSTENISFLNFLSQKNIFSKIEMELKESWKRIRNIQKLEKKELNLI